MRRLLVTRMATSSCGPRYPHQIKSQRLLRRLELGSAHITRRADLCSAIALAQFAGMLLTPNNSRAPLDE